MYSTELKIKRLSLADEARRIRSEEHRARSKRKTEMVLSLHLHRVLVVRPAARAAHLAHAFLRGYPYSRVERNSRTHPPLGEVRKLVSRFGPVAFKEEVEQEVKSWFEAAVAGTTENSKSLKAGSTPVAAST